MTTERKSRRSRADSKEAAVNAFVAAGKTVEPPSDISISNSQRVIFDEVIAEFAKVDWTPHTIRLAAMLAKSISNVQEAQEELGNDFTVTTPKGGVAQNPIINAINAFSAQILSMRRSLALHATAGGAGKREVGRRRQINKGHEDDAPDNDEDLIATPPVG